MIIKISKYQIHRLLLKNVLNHIELNVRKNTLTVDFYSKEIIEEASD
ncbi:hypothetical protein [Spirochaeta cellobiosiphila]|nr:hypothetical protein [Spirochaeta cellobiosiphila]